jgi:hypothetical protein
MLAVFRTHDVDFAVFVHVLGAMVLVGALVASAAAGILGWRGGAPRLQRLSYLILLAVALPGWIVMRVGAEWAYSKEQWDKIPGTPTWLNIGFMTADGGGFFLLVSLIIGGVALRRGGSRLLQANAVISVVLVAAYVVTIWAMGGKTQ